MEELKSQIKREARRHSNKLVKKLSAVADLPEIAVDAIHQEILYSAMDGYRVTMRNRNGESVNEQTEDSQWNR